jgi:hypothetical protein
VNDAEVYVDYLSRRKELQRAAVAIGNLIPMFTSRFTYVCSPPFMGERQSLLPN